MEERISLIRDSGISEQLISEESTVTASPSRWTEHPRCSRILHAVSTSLSWGQLCKTLLPALINVAASRGKELFLAPWTLISPERGTPPSIINFPMQTPPKQIKDSSHYLHRVFYVCWVELVRQRMFISAL